MVCVKEDGFIPWCMVPTRLLKDYTVVVITENGVGYLVVSEQEKDGQSENKIEDINLEQYWIEDDEKRPSPVV